MMSPNLSYIDKIAAGDHNFRKKLISIIKQELPQEIELYEDHIQNGTFEQRAGIVHKIKHKVSLLGMDNGYALTAKYEENLRNGSLDGKENFDQILKRIITFIEEL
ncbi:Hpt domain-containing protein [Aureitalea marina]|uniref:HPt domain-containing protein n=1 Tax=Aureitalea marina TaxID=930804 RepID=A0A2S7KLJ1_9FLAO|nr:Hpt domain-containing protein [Aureitalea marina]PQB03487.1 hypothetical protein BST85_00195 [Aureitalea marina]